jgi:hypothetical protein
VKATNSPSSFEVTTDSNGVVGHAGAALLRELADRLGLTRALGWGQQGARRRHPDAAVLRDLAGDARRWRRLPERPGGLAGPARAVRPGGLHPDRLAGRGALGPGPGRAGPATPGPRARSWAGMGGRGDPEVELLVIDADATLVLAHSDRKEGAAGTYKHSFGFAPLLAYLDRGQAPGEPLAGLLRPGNAAPGAADDLIALVDLGPGQLPRSAGDQPVLVRSDSAGASSACRSTPMSVRRSWPNPSRPGPSRRCGADRGRSGHPMPGSDLVVAVDLGTTGSRPRPWTRPRSATRQLGGDRPRRGPGAGGAAPGRLGHPRAILRGRRRRWPSCAAPSRR